MRPIATDISIQSGGLTLKSDPLHSPLKSTTNKRRPRITCLYLVRPVYLNLDGTSWLVVKVEDGLGVIVQSDHKIINCQSAVTNSGDQQRKCVCDTEGCVDILFHVMGKLERQTTEDILLGMAVAAPTISYFALEYIHLNFLNIEN